MIKKRLLIFGVSGMLGHTLFTELSKDPDMDVQGTVRSYNSIQNLSGYIFYNTIHKLDIRKIEKVEKLVRSLKPDIVINAVGIVKQLAEANNIEISFPINTLWPHQLARIALKMDAYTIQISSDCVFSGNKGKYTEDDTPDPRDIYFND
jgi:dTDP-4-dehydrorhamnose reductase